MATTIKLKNSVTTTNTPSSLAQGEVAINVTDKKVWVGNAATTPIQLLGGGADGNFTNISVSSVATFGAGTVSAPSITTSGDTNTGIFFPAADTIAFTEGGVESMRIDSSGNVGIGTSSPSTKLHVEQSTTGDAFKVARGGNYIIMGGSGSGTQYVKGYEGTVAFGNAFTGNTTFLTGDTERMRIDSAGNVGIGTSSPSSYVSNGGLAIDNTVATNTGQVVNLLSSGSSWFKIGRLTASSTAILQSGQDLALQPDSGNVGIGTPSPAKKLDVYLGTTGTVAQYIRNTTINGLLQIDGTTSFQVGTETNHPLLLLTNNTERMRINSAGQIAWGTSSIDGYLTLTWAGQTYVGFVMNNTDAFGTSTNIRFKNNGTTVGEIASTTTTTSYNTSSDYRLKENIATMTGALAKVAQLKPVTYTWKANGEASQGFIAHELQAVVPDCVTGEKDAVDADGKPVYQGVDTSFLVATLTAAIQELKAELDSVKAELQTLKGN
jgi:hypothetical protein